MISAVREKCAGLDVHRDTVWACVMWGPAQGEAQWEMRRFTTTHAGLEELRQWLEERECVEVVAESTGPYWEPVLNGLELSCRFRLANPQEVKNRRGHKTDKKDAWWLAHLFRHDMIRASYLPVRPVRELRMLTRRRRELIRNAAQEKNRIQKYLEQSSIKLRGVLSDVFGASGAAMLEALILRGETDPEQIASLAKGSLKKKQKEIAAALEGYRLPPAHRFLIRQTMEHLAVMVEQLDEIEDEIQRVIQNCPEFREAAELVQTIPGFDRVAAAETVAEVGPTVKAFPSGSHLSSWTGVCPGNRESAGKNKSGKTTKGNPYFRATLNQSAWASSHTKGSSFQARYQRLSSKIGHRGAIIAVANALAHVIYNVLNYRRPYQDTEAYQLVPSKAKRLVRHHQRRIKYLQPFAAGKMECNFARVLSRLDRVGPACRNPETS
jgi:transposase